MGCDVDTSRLVLMHYRDVAKAIERLFETSGALPLECQVIDTTVGIVSNLGKYSNCRRTCTFMLSFLPREFTFSFSTLF